MSCSVVSAPGRSFLLPSTSRGMPSSDGRSSSACSSCGVRGGAQGRGWVGAGSRMGVWLLPAGLLLCCLCQPAPPPAAPHPHPPPATPWSPPRSPPGPPRPRRTRSPARRGSSAPTGCGSAAAGGGAREEGRGGKRVGKGCRPVPPAAAPRAPPAAAAPALAQPPVPARPRTCPPRSHILMVTAPLVTLRMLKPTWGRGARVGAEGQRGHGTAHAQGADCQATSRAPEPPLPSTPPPPPHRPPWGSCPHGTTPS
jgi:hypothetical protein